MIVLGNLVLAIGLPVLLYQSKLITTVDHTHVHIHYVPFRKKSISVKDIVNLDVCEYNPWEYGGWGIKLSLKGHGWAYTVSGKKGVRLKLANGEQFLLGSQRLDELPTTIQQVRHTLTNRT